MVKTGKTRTKKPRSRSRKFKKAVLGRPQGAIQKRVQAVGPEKFGIVAVDCAKARSKWMLTDFYGNILNSPTNVEHDRSSFQLAMLTLKQAIEKHDLKDVIVAVEMTGTYHKPPMRAFRKAGYETRLVHPFASSFYRQPEHGDDKTDDNDLDAIFRAAVNGFGLIEKPIDAIHHQLQILARHRRDLVKIRFHKATLERVIVWAANATEPDPMAIFHTRVWTSQLDDWTQKTQQIHAIERDLAGILAKTPYVLLLSHPGINVVTAAELAGEMGPIENYASARAVCGRAGLFPSRYQSDEVDRTGKLTRFRNAKLRAAWMMMKVQSFRRPR